MARPNHELPDVDRGVVARDAVEHHMQPVATGKQGIDEGLGQVHPPARRLQHPLNQIPHLRGRQHRRGQLMPTLPRHEHPIRPVDPDLLHRRIIQIPLQRAEPSHPRNQLLDHRPRIRQRQHHTRKTAFVVRTHRRLSKPPHRSHICKRINAITTDLVTNRLVQRLDIRGHSREQSRIGRAHHTKSHPVPSDVATTILAQIPATRHRCSPGLVETRCECANAARHSARPFRHHPLSLNPPML
jgi:hypothetical protein